MANELWIYDVIGESFWESGVTAKSVRDELAKFDKDSEILVRIKSPGGAVDHAVAIKTMLDQWKGPVNVQIDGLAASAASFIAMAGENITIAEGSLFMIHNPWTVVAGNATELRKVADIIDKLGVDLTKSYAKRSGKTAEELAQLMDAETWYTADEAIEHGFADSKVDEHLEAVVIPAIMGFKHPPQPAKEPEQRPANRLAVLQRQVDLDKAALRAG